MAVLGLFFCPIFVIAERSAGRGEWTPVGPEGGQIRCLAVAPSNPSIVYAGSGTGRVFRSNDSGRSWSLASDGIAAHEPYLIFSLSVDPKDPLTAYAGADVVFKTTDGGRHWSALPNLPVNDNNGFVVADTATSGVVYVGTNSGLFKSSDGGSTWSQLQNGLPAGGQVSPVAVAKSNPSVLYAFAATPTGAVLYKSNDTGEHWAATSLADNAGIAIVVDPRNPDIVFANRQRSSDGGRTWSANDLSIVVTALSQDESIAYGTNFGPVLYESGDGGTTWHVIATGPPDEEIESFVVADSSLLAGLRQAGVYRSPDGGRSWQSSSSGLTGFHIACFAVAPAAPERLWVGTGTLADSSAKTVTSPDGGSHWVVAHDGDLHVDAIAADPNDPNTAFVAAFPAQTADNPYAYVSVFRKTSDAGAAWNDELISSCSTTNLLVADPRHSGLLYWLNYACHNPINGPVLYRSADGGASWATLAFETGTVAIDPTENARLYRSDVLNSGQIFRSDDSGRGWVATAPIDDSTVSQIAVGNDASSTVLVAGSKGIWKSVDSGGSWVLVDGVPAPSSGYATIATNLIFPGLFVASVNGRFFVSANAGLAWQPLTSSGFTGEPVMQLIGSKEGDLFAITPAEVFALHLIAITRPPSPNPPAVVRHR